MSAAFCWPGCGARAEVYWLGVLHQYTWHAWWLCQVRQVREGVQGPESAVDRAGTHPQQRQNGSVGWLHAGKAVLGSHRALYKRMGAKKATLKKCAAITVLGYMYV